VFDNVESQDALQDYMPAGGSGAVLITSRNPDSQHGLSISGLKVPCFDADEGSAFLFSMLPGVDGTEHNNRSAAISLTKKLGGSPLGLKQIGGFIRETGCGVEELLQLLTDKAQEKQIFEDSTGFASLGYSHNLSAAWKISLSRLDKLTLSLLIFFSVVDPDHIPETITTSLRSSIHKYEELFPNGNNNIK
jgi:hypothetical protein